MRRGTRTVPPTWTHHAVVLGFFGVACTLVPMRSLTHAAYASATGLLPTRPVNTPRPLMADVAVAVDQPAPVVRHQVGRAVPRLDMSVFLRTTPWLIRASATCCEETASIETGTIFPKDSSSKSRIGRRAFSAP